MRGFRANLYFFLLAFCILPAAPAGAQSRRVEVPIIQREGSNGRYFYFLHVSIGGLLAVPVLMDSGSTGLRVLPGLVEAGKIMRTAQRSVYGYSSGSRFNGVIARASLSVGGLAARRDIAFQLISEIGCYRERPSCPAAGIPIAAFGFAREGLAERQRARLGISLQAADAENPLALIGNGKWIVDLPLPGAQTPGRLILNPQQEDIAGFRKISFSGGVVRGCVRNEDIAERICGEVLLDTGGNGLSVEAPERPQGFPWAPNARTSISLGEEGDGSGLAIPFTNQRRPGSPYNVHWVRGGMRDQRIAGSLPFLVYTVLFDGVAKTISVKPR